ncbi:hypothetical protein [Chitinophaga sp. LS1]|uniref:hypothetical protein n=1 Tax=Chitinophaga sp. LS1 TaxID=3051176 RepID=UPI002AAAE9F7|nr:hypothetical protein [Chitinophaga sp. LS1]WPV66376.1 hypothetical protein QQL36_31775 [Chitinophaga sp. LS1]
MNLLSNIAKIVNTKVHTIPHLESNTQFASTLETEKENIISALQKKLFSLDDKLDQYIQLHQKKLSELMETISNILPEELFTTPPPDNHLIQLYYTLYDIQVCLEKDCAPYLDFHCKIPFIYLLSARQAFTKEIPLLRQLLSSFGIIDFVQEIIIAPFEEVLQTDNISYHRLYYIKELSKHLQQLPSDSTSEHVENILIYMNFNNEIYLNYRLDIISENIKSFPTTQQQLIQTKLLLKMNSQKRQHPNYRYTHHLPSLKEQIRDWLTDEHTFLEQKILYPENTLLPEEVARWQAYKVKVDLSVNELGYLIRLMIEHGLILNDNRTEVADFFAQYFATNNQKSLSHLSLRQKMYNYPPSSTESVRGLLLDLFNTSKQLKNDHLPRKSSSP